MRQSDMDEQKDQRIHRCSAAGQCGGCIYSGVSYDKQLQEKQKKVRKLLNGIVSSDCVKPVVGMDDPLYYRNKVHAAFGTGKGGSVLCGRYAAGSHYIVQTDDCLLENEQAQKIIRDIRDLAVSFRIPIYDEVRNKGCLRRVLVRCAHATGQILVVLVLGSSVFPSRTNFLSALKVIHPEITTVVQNINTRHDSMILGERSQVLAGNGYIEDQLCGLMYRISPASFYQVNSVQTHKLYGKAIQMARLTGNEQIVDAYCGIGTIGMTAAAAGAGGVTGIEQNADAVRDAISNAKRNRLENIRFVRADATEYLSRSARAGAKADVIFMDPPRAGSTPAFIRAAAAMHPRRIIYVSCNPQTLARDLKLLQGQNYIAQEVVPYDMFPFTGEVECCTLLVHADR